MGLNFNPLIFSGFDITSSGSSAYFLDPVATEGDLLPSLDGALIVVKATDCVYVYDTATSKWINTGITASGSVGNTPNALGLSINSTNSGLVTSKTLQLQPADSTHPGILSTSTQTIGGSKEFVNDITVDGIIYGSTLDTTTVGGTLSIGIADASTVNIGRSGATVNIFGSVNAIQTTNLNVTDALITLNKGGSVGSATNSGIELEENNIITGYIKTTAARDGYRISAPGSSGEMILKPDNNGFSETINTSTLTTNRTYTLPDITGGFVLDAGTQTIAGNKTLSGTTNLSGLIASLPLKLDVSKNITSSAISLTADVIGTLPIANGGTNSTTTLNNNRIMQSSGGAIVEASAITAARALISDANGIPTASGVTSTELGYVNGVTSAIQTQLDSKQGVITGAASTVTTTDLSNNVVVVSNGIGKIASSTVSTTTLGYLDATSSIQTQLNGKANRALSNLALVAINTSLLPDTAFAYDLGSTGQMWNVTYTAAIKNSTGVNAINVTNRTIYDVSGNPSFDGNNRNLQNSSGSQMLLWSGTSLDANTHKVVNVVDPTSAQDAATKNYVDNKFVTGDILPTTVLLGNNVSTFTDIPSFSFTGLNGFEAIVKITVLATTNLYETVKIIGVAKASTWEISLTRTGDDTGVIFDITSTGQIQFKSSNIAGYSTSAVRFRALVV